MRRRGKVAYRLTLSLVTCLCVLLAGDVLAAPAAAYTPAGEMRWALYVTISPVIAQPGSKREPIGESAFWIA
jgi:hypothetical protein